MHSLPHGWHKSGSWRSHDGRTTVDWQVCQSVRARLRILVLRRLQKWKSPPDQQPNAVGLGQALGAPTRRLLIMGATMRSPLSFPFVVSWGMWCALVAGCASPPPTPRGEVQGAAAAPAELAQSDVNRLATLAMQENLDSLYRLMDKLYRRNPAEWRKTSALGREHAMVQVRAAIALRQPWAPLQGQRDVAALALALAPEFADDRVAAFIHAVADMLITAHGGKTEFFLIDGLDAQHLYNAARNLEVAVWMLAQRRSAKGTPLLLADEINASERNLSYEREFGKVIARLDLLALVTTEKYRRAVIGYVQGLAGSTFLQFLPVR